MDGKKFASLTNEEVKEMVPPLGLAKKVLRLMPKVNMHASTDAILDSLVLLQSPFPTLHMITCLTTNTIYM